MATSSPVLPADFKAVISDPTASLCGNFISTLIRLPQLIYQLVAWMLDDSGNLNDNFTRVISDTTLRPGDLIPSMRINDSTGRLLCDGSAVVRATYPELFAAIGTTYGPGNGTTTFELPDFRDKFPRGVGGAGVGAEGDGEMSLIADNIPQHKHLTPMFVVTPPGGSSVWEDLQGSVATSAHTCVEVTGSTRNPCGHPYSEVNKYADTAQTLPTPINPLPPFLVCFYYIKT